MYTMGGCGTSLAPAPVSTPGLPNAAAPTQGLWAPGMSGLGCPDCNNTCGGMGGLTMDGSGLFGTGIFGTGVSLTDLSTWTWAEYATLALGAYTLLSLVHTTKAVGRHTKVRAKKIKKGFTS